METKKSSLVAVSLGLIFLLLGVSCGKVIPKGADEGGFSGEGHGGNPSVKAKLDDAKSVAPRILYDLTDQQIDSIENPLVRDFVRNNRVHWADDITESDHDWPANEREEAERLSHYPEHLKSRAAVTQTKGRAPIKFSWTVAERVVFSLDEAVDVLLHESAHHLEETDEAFVKLLVAEVMHLWKQTRTPDVIALKPIVCERLADYYLLSNREDRESFLTVCGGSVSVYLGEVFTVPPYDAVSAVDVRFSLNAAVEDMTEGAERRAFNVRGVAHFLKMASDDMYVDLGWKVNRMSIHTPFLRDEVTEFFAILEKRPATLAGLFQEYPHKIKVIPYSSRFSYHIYDSAFPRASLIEGDGSYFPLSTGDTLVVYLSSTGKWWPLAYTPEADLVAYSGPAAYVGPMAAKLMYTTPRLVAPFMDKEPAAETLIPQVRYQLRTSSFSTTNLNHVNFLGPGPLNGLPFFKTNLNIKEHLLQNSLRELRMAPVLQPSIEDFEDQLRTVKKRVGQAVHSRETLNIFASEMREIRAHYFLRYARHKRGDGVLAFLNYMGRNKDILRYGLSREELSFLVLRALSTYLETAHHIPEDKRLQSFKSNLELLGWNLDSFGIDREVIQQLIGDDATLLLKFRLYDEAQTYIKVWREEEGLIGLTERINLNNYLLTLELDTGIELSEVGLHVEAVEDAFRSGRLIDAYRILVRQLLPRTMLGHLASVSDLIEITEWTSLFREAANESFYSIEYLLVGEDLFPAAAPHGIGPRLEYDLELQHLPSEAIVQRHVGEGFLDHFAAYSQGNVPNGAALLLQGSGLSRVTVPENSLGPNRTQPQSPN